MGLDDLAHSPGADYFVLRMGSVGVVLTSGPVWTVEDRLVASEEEGVVDNGSDDSTSEGAEDGGP